MTHWLRIIAFSGFWCLTVMASLGFGAELSEKQIACNARVDEYAKRLRAADDAFLLSGSLTREIAMAMSGGPLKGCDSMNSSLMEFAIEVTVAADHRQTRHWRPGLVDRYGRRIQNMPTAQVTEVAIDLALDIAQARANEELTRGEYDYLVRRLKDHLKPPD